MNPSLPSSLRTRTPTEGLELARRLSAEMLATLPNTSSMADHLTTSSASMPAPELVTAVYFHAVAQANSGWSKPC